MLPVARAIEAFNTGNLTPVVLDDDHAFRKARADLHVAVATWLQNACLPELGH